MVNNIVYFGRIITTILLISLIRPIRLISLIRPIHLVRLISHSRATLAPLLSFRSLCFLRLPPRMDSRLRKPDSFALGLPPLPFGGGRGRLPVPPVPKVLTDLRVPFSFGPRRILYVHYAGLYPARPSVLRLPSVGLQTPDSPDSPVLQPLSD